MGKILSVKDKVEKLVRKYPVLLDDDLRLKSNYWNEQLQELGLGNLKNISAHDFLDFHADGILANGDYITRARRKLQEMHDELKTELWYKRHESSQIAVMQDLDIMSNEKGISY